VNIQSAINAGLFVQFVANQWNSTSQATVLDGRPVLNAAGTPVIPGLNYTVLRTIYACDLATDLDPTKPGREGWKTMGILAVNQADPNDYFIAIRGTLTIWEWLQDAKFLPKPFPNVAGAGLTEDGFTDMYQSFSLTPGDCEGKFLADLIALLPATARVTIAGHSLGAGIATLLALDMGANSTLPVVLYTLASPRVGDLTFSHLFNHVVPNAYRIANRLDIVPKVPPPLLYFHVGDETELVPSGEMKFDLACEHHLTSYFNMLGTLSNQAAAYPIQANCLKGSPQAPSQADV
jgi:hypothetical protein